MSTKAVRQVEHATSAGCGRLTSSSCLHLPFSNKHNRVSPSSPEDNEPMGRSLNLLQANGNLSSHDNGLEDSSSDEMRLFENQHSRGVHEQNGHHSQAMRSRMSANVVAKCMLFQHNDLQPSFWLFVQKYKKALNDNGGTLLKLSPDRDRRPPTRFEIFSCYPFK